MCKCIFLLHSKCFVNLDKCSYFENRQLFFAIATLCLLPWKLFVELCTWIHKLHRYSALVHRPPVDLHLIFEKSSLQNQVGRTWFFVYFELDFCRLHRQKKIKFKICKKSSWSNLIFRTWFFKNQVEINRGETLVHELFSKI